MIQPSFIYHQPSSNQHPTDWWQFDVDPTTINLSFNITQLSSNYHPTIIQLSSNHHPTTIQPSYPVNILTETTMSKKVWGCSSKTNVGELEPFLLIRHVFMSSVFCSPRSEIIFKTCRLLNLNKRCLKVWPERAQHDCCCLHLKQQNTNNTFVCFSQSWTGTLI